MKNTKLFGEDSYQQRNIYFHTDFWIVAKVILQFLLNNVEYKN